MSYSFVIAASAGGSTLFLREDGTWASVATPPGGANKEVQFNDAGAFGGDSALTWDKATNHLEVASGALTAGIAAIKGTATNANAAGQQFGFHFEMTSAGTTPSSVIGTANGLLAGYTGTGQTNATNDVNQAAGQGVGAHFDGNYSGNHGAQQCAVATTVGTNVGALNYAQGGDVNIGGIGSAITAKAGAANVGQGGMAADPGGGGTFTGGVFKLGTAALTHATAALLADNGAEAAPIALFRDNGTTKVEIADGGRLRASAGVTIVGATTVARLDTATGTYWTSVLTGGVEVWTDTGSAVVP